MKTNASPVLITVLLACFALVQNTQAVSPAPDGGYPGQNTAEGQSALLRLAGGTYNTAVGWSSLGFNVTGNFNTGVGAATLLTNTADNNTATGAGALLSNTTGGSNTANGAFALFSNTSGGENTANGYNALLNTTGSTNTAIGSSALIHNTGGNGNTAVGDSAFFNNTTGSGNIALGFNAGQSVTMANNVICIGADGNDVDNSCYIGQIFSSTVSASAVFVNSNGRLGTMTSSKRFKQDIKPMDNVSEALYSLKPVSFRYKKEFDPAGSSQLGLVAEDVEKVSPDLVVRDKEGKPYSVRYEQVNAMLLNEFLKEHCKNEEQEKTITELKSGMTALTATVKEQASQIQKVSAQLEASKPAPQVVNNP